MNSSRVIDNDLLDALMVPAKQGDYPRDSHAFVRIDCSLRVYWHSLFDICPDVLALTTPDGLAIYRPFMAWANERQLSLDWTYYLWVYQWLLQSEFRERVTPKIARALTAASAARWAVGDRSASGGIAVGCADFPELVVAWKSHHIDEGREIELVELDEPLPTPPGKFGYFTIPQFELNTFPGWSEILR
ncbi:MAG: methanobactin biosynthesis cassette protein MbnC [Gallionella sp.]|nr:methanobactin biosynthesis cassette protein MbnC [Gallionella sp.]